MLGQTVPRSDPQQLGLVRIELETLRVSGHPLTDICDAAFETISCRRSVVTTAVQIHLRVVGERMYRYIVLLGYSCEVRRVYNEQQRTEHRALWNRTHNGDHERRTAVLHNAKRNVLPERYDRSHASTIARCHAVQTGVRKPE